MKHAISHLQSGLATAEHNEPIHRAEGNTEQADLEAAAAAEIRLALAIITLISIGPAYPEPTGPPISDPRDNRTYSFGNET